ncbi:CMP-N-acetylneuraminate-beta-galactosamide-alpha-2,3-sialyltransferase 1-like isoform X2 [Brienomyrus brachyistius]|uniref:CMP-N-acetylneuraminate-beta-galactosamide- alpha-2,3-sialyltransferase 1-like isoform X2 n=1 Tax=Brienomyrus brachyistius TaxID=42636 RepID=UPI0020B41E07|nr:CMP-N-acetylneuraminate-beta-galactosamide-alpha-2,3-sialyltransferase 1-like isoform X2 [Brienomyrus brachyistius]
MFVIKPRNNRKFALFCIISLTMLFLSYTYHNPSMYLLKLAFRQPSGDFSKGPCACATCITEMDDDWFSEHFNQSIQPLLSRKNSLLSEDTYNWWQWLQREKDPANYSDVVQRLFEVIPDEEWYVDSGPGRCRTCAVVGNSGNLKGSSYGARIDSHDFVIRMNHAPTLGYEDDVGSKTTHHLMYPESAKHLQNSTSLVLVPFKTLDLEWVISALTTGTITQTYIPVKSRIKVNKDKVLVYNPTFFKYIYDNWLENHGRYPSTGFLALMFAIHICDEVSVYGFGADMNGNWHHYWENNPGAGAFRHTGVHDGDYEYNITMLLADKDKIKVFKGR